MKEKKDIIIIIQVLFIILLIAAIIGIYLLREKDKDTFNSRINTLNTQIEQLQATISDCNKAKVDKDEEETVSDLPVVFTPGGKFTEDEKSTLMEKIVEPYFDYQEDVGHPVQAMIIEYPSPQDDFSEYIVNAILKIKEEEGGGYAYNGELFGSTEEEYDYWYPFSPLTAPDLTEDFINDYPEVIEKFCEAYDCEELGIE